MAWIDGVLFGFGCVLVGVAVTLLLLCKSSEAITENHDPIEQALTLVFTGVPGTLGLVLIAAAIL